MTLYIDRFTGARAAVEARLVEFLSFEERDNHESFNRPNPAFVWQDETTRVAPEQGGEWWTNMEDKELGLSPDLEGWDAIDERLSLEMDKARRAKREEARIQWATDKIARMFFRVQTQRDLDEAFRFMGQVKDRGFVAGGIVALARARVARNRRKAKQAQIDGLRELNHQMGDWARSISYRVRLDDEQESVAQEVRNQSWVLVEMRPGIGAVCRGKDVRGRPVVMAEPEIFSFMQSQTA